MRSYFSSLSCSIKLKTRMWISLGVIVALVMSIDLTLSYYKLKEAVEAEAHYDARSVYGFMMATRRIYQQQFVDSGLPVSDQTIGFLPAHSFSRIAKDFGNWNKSGIYFNNVSDIPRNPANQADHHEMEDIAWYRANPSAKEHTKKIVDNHGERFLLFTAPIWFEPFCLKCHGAPEKAPQSIRQRYSSAYNYEVGDLRGLVSIRIPTRHFDARVQEVWGAQLIKSLLSYRSLNSLSKWPRICGLVKLR